MSGNRPQRPPLDQDPTRYRRANILVRSILDDRPPTADISPSGELIRAIARFHHNVERVRRDISAHQAGPESSMSSGSDRELRRRFNRDPQPANESLPTFVPPNPPSLPPLRSGSRVRLAMASGGPAGRASRYRPSDRSGDRLLDRPQAFFERRQHDFERQLRLNRDSAIQDLQDIDRDLESANSHLQALLDITNNPIMTQSHMPASIQNQDHGEETRRIKRRKLDSDRLTPYFKGVQYGKYGQVEPGELQMEIVSCDGGLYSDEPSYAPENILKHDTSVYCTKGNRCNIVLRHHGATVFSLKELIIKAPGSDYSSPVRQGMVFISMNSDELLTRTAQYQIQYLPARNSRPAIYSVRHTEEGRERYQPRHRRGYMEEDDDHRTAQIPSEFDVLPPPFHITTECSDDESDGDTGIVMGSLRAPRRRTPRIGTLPFENEADSSDDGGDGWGPSGSDWTPFDELARGSSYPRGRSEHGSGMTLEEAQEASQIATQEAVRAVGGELMTPLARFHIEKNKSKCTIRFDPPVSGRFILLKMWSPHHDPSKNIDIQGVIAKGFAGPRLIPSVELR